MDPTHRRLAQIGLQAAERFGFALAGGYAVQEHGLIQRLSEDVDLFTSWDRRADFADAVRVVVDSYREHGYRVDIVEEFDTFARLIVHDVDQPDRPFKVELAANWRAQPPVMMDIGPVLHADDVVARRHPRAASALRRLARRIAGILSPKSRSARACVTAAKRDAACEELARVDHRPVDPAPRSTMVTTAADVAGETRSAPAARGWLTVRVVAKGSPIVPSRATDGIGFGLYRRRIQDGR